MTEQNWRLVFLTGAGFNLAVAGFFALLPSTALQLFGFAGLPGEALWYALCWWLVAVFGIGYYLVSRDPSANRGIAVLGLIGKLGVWAIVSLLWLQGQVPWLFALLVCGDLLYSLLFLWFLISLPQTGLQPGRTGG